MSETMEISGREFELSNPDKVLFPDSGATKRDLVNYYAEVADVALRHWKDRPVSMHRFPDGVDQEGFFQKNAPDYFPDWIRRVEFEKEGGTVHHVVADHPAVMAYLAAQGTVEPHLGLSKVDKVDHPDRMIFDLDPSDDDFSKVREAAEKVKALLDRIEAPAFVQTTGSKGFHIVVPLDRSAAFDAARDLAHRIAERLAEDAPKLMTVEQRKNKRGDRVFVDYLRNAYGQTSIAPYGVRARPEAPVATPLEWDEALGDTGPRDYTLGNILRRLGQKEDPWADIDRHAVGVSNLAERFGKLAKA